MATSQSTHVAFVPQRAVTVVNSHARYLAEVPAESVVARVTHEGLPLGKHRPRFNRRTGRVYTPNATKTHQASLAAAAVKAAGPFTPDDQHTFGIRAVFYVQTHHRKDVDNMLKAVLDAMNQLVFKDDVQVKEVMGWSVLDCLNPRTEFVVYRLGKIDRDQGACVRCGKAFRRYQSWKQRLYCSRKCNAIATTKAVEVPCARCGKKILRIPAVMKENVGGEYFCSSACLGLHKRVVAVCAECGVSFSRQRSSVKQGQTVFYCNRACLDKGMVGRKVPASPERLSDRSRRAWVTRKANQAAAGN